MNIQERVSNAIAVEFNSLAFKKYFVADLKNSQFFNLISQLLNSGE
jgi:hypothetical protein